MTRYWLTKLAEADLEEIHDYIATGSPPRADQYIDSLMDDCQTIRDYPFIGSDRSEFGAGVRVFPVGSHLIFYRIVGPDVEILRFLHGRRDIKSLS